jgi:glycosyltransferase involved in cell wall biosynthesis
LLCLGRLVELKGFDIAMTAFRGVLSRWPAARLIVAGDGPGREDLRRQAAALALEGSVDFTGFIAPRDTAALINAATAVIVPSRKESLGRVAVEAGLMARPVVAAAVGGLREAVVHGVNGLLVAPDDSEALCGAVLQLLARPEAADAMGAAGRIRAREMFSWTDCVDDYDARYRRLMEDAGDVSVGRTSAAQ